MSEKRLIMSREDIWDEDRPKSKYRMERLTSPRRVRTFLTYDLEWYPDNYELRIVGVYDGEQYRHYTSIGDFIKGELTCENHGK